MLGALDPRKHGNCSESPQFWKSENGEIEFRVVNNDGSRESTIILTDLKCLFQKQLPKMPQDYIARLVYDPPHLSIAIVKMPMHYVSPDTVSRGRSSTSQAEGSCLGSKASFEQKLHQPPTTSAMVNKDEVADCYNVIEAPIDLSEERLKHDKYAAPKDLIDNLKLIFSNYRRYNDATTVYTKYAAKLKKYMWSLIKEIPEFLAYLRTE